ncbi:hypothetical protein DPMN_155968 [Dreissena polymorpha]|uniref:Uncharacterized protein n=1 Tax=Dreissena polymorpha TaxID=45954 RepID=A0A9D4JBE7_DREPO|nr:hypothetical protein DPMN_155968 [Dreissena polymorpha]
MHRLICEDTFHTCDKSRSVRARLIWLQSWPQSQKRKEQAKPVSKLKECVLMAVCSYRSFLLREAGWVHGRGAALPAVPGGSTELYPVLVLPEKRDLGWTEGLHVCIFKVSITLCSVAILFYICHPYTLTPEYS